MDTRLLNRAWIFDVICCIDGDGGGSGGGSGDGSGGGGDDHDDDRDEHDDDQDDSEVDWEKRAKAAERDREKWKVQSRKHEDRAKKNATAATELEKVRTGQLGEQDRAIAEARGEERKKVAREYGAKLAAAEFRAAAAGRMDGERLDALLEDLDLSRYVGDDGEVDTDRVRERVDKIAPARSKTDDDDGEEDGRRGGGKKGTTRTARGGAGMGQGRNSRGRDGKAGGVAGWKDHYQQERRDKTAANT